MSTARPSRGVPYHSSAESAPLPATHLTAMRAQARELSHQLVDTRRAVHSNVRAFNFIVSYGAVPAALRGEAREASATASAIVGQLLLIEQDLTRWQHDLNHYVQLHPQPTVQMLGAARHDPGLLEYGMELTDLLASYAHQANHSRSDAQVQLLAHLAPFLRPGPRPAGPDIDPGAGGDGGSGGVQASPSGAPEAIDTLGRAYRASWETHARWFQCGCSVNADTNRRQTRLQDGSRVEIQAHMPVLTYSLSGELLMAGAVVASIAGTLATAGAAGAVLVGGTALVGGLLVRPFDATWQGYTARYYASGQTQAWGQQHFFGRKTTSGGFASVTVNGERQVQRFVNFADQWRAYQWESWWRGEARERPPQFESADVRPACAQSQTATCAEQQCRALLQTLAQQNAPPGGAGLDKKRLLLGPNTASTFLLASDALA